MPTPSQLFFSLLLPAIICGGIYAIVAYLWKRDEKNGYLQRVIAVALGIGYIIGYLGIESKLTFLPKEPIHWVFYFTILAMVISTFWHLSQWIRLITQFVFAIALPRVLLNSYFQYNTWGTLEGTIWWVCLSVGILIFWNIVEQSFSAVPSKASIPFVYFGLSGGTALIIALSGSVLIAQHAGTLTALFAVIWILTIVLQRGPKFNTDSNWEALPISASPVVIILFVGVWMNGYFYAEVPAVSALLLVIAPVFAQVGQIKAIQRLGERKSILLQIGLIALCVGIAIIIAVVRSGFFSENVY